VSIVSHEIRTPLTALVGMTEALAMSGLNAEQTEMLAVMKDAEQMLLALVNNVLDLSRAETGRIVLERAPLDVRALVAQRCGMVEGEVRRKGVALSWAVSEQVPATVLGDPLRVGQVLANLLGNAVKFTEKGSIKVGVTCERIEEGACMLAFRVADTGIGIPTEKLSTVFDVFTQADASTTRRYGGSGLGLAICRRLVDLMGGTIRASSAPGQGSEFECVIGFAVNVSV
jgi:signal transduction histidine kinase